MSPIEALHGHTDLRAHLPSTRDSGSLLEVDAWIPSEIKAVTPLVNRSFRLAEGSHCITGEES